jgi:hypothetical protein
MITIKIRKTKLRIVKVSLFLNPLNPIRNKKPSARAVERIEIPNHVPEDNAFAPNN